MQPRFPTSALAVTLLLTAGLPLAAQDRLLMAELSSSSRDSLNLPEAPLPQQPQHPAEPQEPKDPDEPQEPQATPQEPHAEPSETDLQNESDREIKQEEQQRVLGIMPAFNAVMNGHAAPLRPGQKFNLFFHSAIDPYQFAIAAADAGIGQADDAHPGYHQGAEGYAKRFGAAYADAVDGNFWGNAVLPVLFHQDPRYFRLGTGAGWHRVGYALLSTVRCRGDNGNWQFSYSNIGGNFIGGAISNVYYPASDRGVGLTITSALTVDAEGALGSLILEFYPDLVAHMKHRHTNAQPAP